MKRLKKIGLIALMTVCMAFTACGSSSKSSGITEKDFLKAVGKELKADKGNGDAVYLRGTNAGGYLLQEFWMTPTNNSIKVNDELGIINVLTERFGEEKAFELIGAYQDNYFTEEDFKNCADMGLNCIRLPFWWRNLADENGNYYGYDEAAEDPYAFAFKRMDWFVETAGKYGLYVILDMHGCPGSQNGSDHSGVDGGNQKMLSSRFWFGKESKANQQLFYDMWRVIAKRYNGNATVAGYDLMNEPFCTYRYNIPSSDDETHKHLWGVYDETYKVIREEDPDHVIIMEAVWDAVDLPKPEDYGWENVMYEYHNYLYDDYDNKAGQQISNMKNKINGINAAGYDVPSYMGEFSYFNNLDAWDEGLKLLNDKNLSWTTWTYKTSSGNGNWGLYHHPGNLAGVNVETDSYERILETWTRSNTAEGKANEKLVEVVSKYSKAE